MNAISTINSTNLDTLRASVPSIFATEAHESRSARFGYISTETILRSLLDNGFEVREAKQGRTKVEGKAAYTKHLIRLNHSSFGLRRSGALGDLHPEIVLRNAHDGTSSYEISLGVLRLWCLNGCVASEGTFEAIRVGHTLRAVEGVTQASLSVISSAQRVLDVANHWRGIELSTSDQHAFAQAARVLRFGDNEGNVTSSVTPLQLLGERRAVDAGNDLWHTFNRVQENAIKGGLRDPRRAQRDEITGKYTPARVLRTRPVKSVDGDLKLNKALWTLAEELAKAKAAA